MRRLASRLPSPFPNGSLTILSLIVFCLLLQSCSSPTVNDLKLVNVQVVPQEQIPSRDKYWSADAITEPLLRVTFSSKINLEELAQEHQYNVENVTSICRQSATDQTRRLRGFPSVLDDVGRIDAYRDRNNSTRKRDGLFEYHIYLDLRQSGISGFYSYDLIRMPADVCFTVNGSKEVGFAALHGFVSNTLIVPKERILSAVAASGKR